MTDGEFVCLVFVAVIVIVTMIHIAVYCGWF